MKALITYDASDDVQFILDELHRAGLPRDAETVVISVADVDTLPVPGITISTPSANDRLNTLLN